MPRFPGYARPQIAPSGQAATAYQAVASQAHATAGLGRAVSEAGNALYQIGQERIRRRNALLASQAQSQVLDYVYQYRDRIDQVDPLQVVQPANGIGEQDLDAYWDRDFQAGLKKHVDSVSKGMPQSVKDELTFTLDAHLPTWRAAISAKIQNTEKQYWQQTIPVQAMDLARQGRIGEATALAVNGKAWMTASRQLALGEGIKGANQEYIETRAWKSLQEMAGRDGWQAALSHLNKPETQTALALDADGVGRLTTRISGQAAIEARQAEQRRNAKRVELTRKMWAGELTVNELDQSLKAEDLDPAEYSGMMAHLSKPKEFTRQQVLAGHVAMAAQVEAVRAGGDPGQAIVELAQYADRMTASESGQYVDRIMDAAKASGKRISNSAKVDLYAGVLRGDIKDLARIDQAAKDEVITTNEQQELYGIIQDPGKPGAEDVLKAHMEMQVAINEVAQRRQSPAEATKLLLTHAAKFTASEGDNYFTKIQDAVKPDNALSTPETKRGHEILDQARAPWIRDGGVLEGGQKWLTVVGQYDDWVKKNPQASWEDHRRQVGMLITPIIMSTWQEMSKAKTVEGIRRLPPDAQDQWIQTKGVDSDEWLEKWRKIKKDITQDISDHYLNIAGGDIVKAKQYLQEDGYK